MREKMPLLRKKHVTYSASPMASTIDQRLRRKRSNRTILIRYSSYLIPALTPINSLHARHARLERDVPAAILKVALQVRHERMTVHDTGRLALDDARVCFDVWFAAEGFIPADEAGRRVAEGLCVGVDFQ
jgi:hypothetical protein